MMEHTCPFCGGAVAQERVDIGKTHCMALPCTTTWARQRREERGLVLVNRHKQGPAWIYSKEVPDNSYRRTGA